jgi:hypothetical protein
VIRENSLSFIGIEIYSPSVAPNANMESLVKVTTRSPIYSVGSNVDSNTNIVPA